jgi:hypothetical protein
MESLASSFLLSESCPSTSHLFLRQLRSEVREKLKNLSKPRITRRRSPTATYGVAGPAALWATAWQAHPSPLLGELYLRKKFRGIPPIATAMPDERNANTDAERGQIQYDHNESKQIHSHRQSD